jgi:anti-sigma factor RsiW
MACETWSQKLGAYFDGELDATDSRALQEHLRQCPACAAEGLEKLQMKQAVQATGMRFTPHPELRARVQTSISRPRQRGFNLRWLPALATAAVLLIVVLLFVRNRDRSEQQLISELTDLHVATLASSNPVDVVSSDRHTVKPWFEGKIPFSFNLPELQGTPFSLVGGRISYLDQSPGAELIFRVRQHQISAFIFQEGKLRRTTADGTNRVAFRVRSWTQNGLRYFVIGDASGQDLDKLAEILQGAG